MVLVMLNLCGFHGEFSQFIHTFYKIRSPNITVSITVIYLVYLDTKVFYLKLLYY
jgi:hypothetical protein